MRKLEGSPHDDGLRIDSQPLNPTNDDRDWHAMPITVCICTHNRPEYLRDCLDALLVQDADVDGFDILVVDSGSSPASAIAIADLVAATANARLLRIERPGLSLARNAAARSVQVGYVAYLDDDAVPQPGWIAAIRGAISTFSPALISGPILPLWEAPLPPWWPRQLMGVLSIVDAKGIGEFRQPGPASSLEPVGANLIVHIPALLAVGGFLETIGRSGKLLLSDEEKVLAWRLQDAGSRIIYDDRVIVHHQIQAERLTVPWLLSRMFWQGVSCVRSSSHLGEIANLRREALRRLAVFFLLWPASLLPLTTPFLVQARWRWAYAHGFLRGYLTRP